MAGAAPTTNPLSVIAGRQSVGDYFKSMGIDPKAAHESVVRKEMLSEGAACSVVQPDAPHEERHAALRRNLGENLKLRLVWSYAMTGGSKYMPQTQRIKTPYGWRELPVTFNLMYDNRVKSVMPDGLATKPTPKLRTMEEVAAANNKYLGDIARGLQRLVRTGGEVPTIFTMVDGSFPSGCLNGVQGMSARGKTVDHVGGRTTVYQPPDVVDDAGRPLSENKRRRKEEWVLADVEMNATRWPGTKHAYGLELGVVEDSLTVDKTRGVGMFISDSVHFKESCLKPAQASCIIIEDGVTGTKIPAIAIKMPFYKTQAAAHEKQADVSTVNARALTVIADVLTWIGKLTQFYELDPRNIIIVANLVCGPGATDENPETFANYKAAFEEIGLVHHFISGNPTGSVGLSGNAVGVAASHLFCGANIKVAARHELVPHPAPIDVDRALRDGSRLGYLVDGKDCGSLYGSYAVDFEFIGA